MAPVHSQHASVFSTCDQKCSTTEDSTIPIRAIYREGGERPGERPLFGLSHDDFVKVRDGYGCPNCLEDFNGVYMARCPLCGHIRDVEQDFLEAPRYWQPDPNDPDRN